MTSGETVLLAALLALSVGLTYDMFFGPQGAKRILLGRRSIKDGFAQGARFLGVGTNEANAIYRHQVGAAVSPSLGVASIGEVYANNYKEAQHADVPDTRVPAPVSWGPYDDDKQPLSEAYGQAFGSAPPSMPTEAQLKAAEMVKALSMMMQGHTTAVAVVPVGISMQGGTQVPLSTGDVCWHDCHPFDWQPCHIPESYDKNKDVYYARGCFCSWECAKAFCVRQSAGRRLGDSVSRIALLANRARSVPSGERPSCLNAVYLRCLPSRERLEMFGGDLSIHEYRAGCMRLDGTIIGSPYAAIPARCVPPSFMQARGVLMIPCTAVQGDLRPCESVNSVAIAATGAPRQSHRPRVPGEDSIRQRLQEHRNPSPSQVTLDNSMGIVVRTRV
ncbi:hypothetical protein JKP88DRAFT_250986 [Tribonema minus]|uniref:Uncharacterized protein n=1 Tax=Tribonema minus TaxID=303371 RepID=A0A835ZFX8_9STRA|nr:hypothetical protein JKP88DRAFT_250986 [Tribonema minus]